MVTFDKDHSKKADRFDEAFKRTLPAMKALTEEEILNVNLRIPDAVSRVLGLQRVLLDVRNRMTDSLPAVEHDFPEKLVQYALALSHAHTLYRMATRASDPVPALAEEAMKLRSLLFSDARALVHRGFVDSKALRNYKGSVSYRNLAFDLQMLAQLFNDCPPPVRALSAAQPAELHRATELAAGILAGLRKRTIPDSAIEAAADLRNRAFTLFTRAYDQVRRAAVFLRWDEGDANQLVPSLYAKHRHEKRKAVPTQMAEQAPPNAPAANDG